MSANGRGTTIAGNSSQSTLADAIGSWTERHPAAFFAGLTAWYVGLIWKLATRPLWSDELFTFYIAQQPTVARMLQAIHSIDLNPPLNYFLTRWSIEMLGSTPFAARLPEIVAYWCGSLALFLLLKRSTTTLVAAVGIVLFWSNPFFSYAAEARPYGLLLGLTAIAVAAWDRALGEKRRAALALLLLSGTMLLLSHILGTLSLGTLWVAEAMRCYRRKTVDWPTASALVLPLLAAVTYLPMFHSFGDTVFPPEAQASWAKLIFLYYATFRWMWRPLLVLAIVAFWYRKRAERETPAIPLENRWLLGCLFLVGVGVTVLFMHSHGAFYERYCIVIVVPIVTAAALLFSRWTERGASASIVAFCATVFLLLLSTSLREPLVTVAGKVMPARAATKVTGLLTTSIHGPFRAWWRPLPLPPAFQLEEAHAPKIEGLGAIDPNLPLVISSELTFLEADQRSPLPVANRLVFLYDRSTEIEIAHRSVAGGMLDDSKFFPLRGRLLPFAPFVQNHRRFLVLGNYANPGEWLLRKLELDGAHLQIIARVSDYGADLYSVDYPANEKGEASASPSPPR